MREVLEQGTTFIRGRRRGRGSGSALARPIRCVLFKLLHPRVALFACLHVSIRVT